MPRTHYQIKNRFCRKSKIDEATFLAISAGTIEGATATFIYKYLREFSDPPECHYSLLEKVVFDYRNNGVNLQSPSLKTVTKYSNAVGSYLFHSADAIFASSFKPIPDLLYSPEGGANFIQKELSIWRVPYSENSEARYLWMAPLDVSILQELLSLSKAKCGLSVSDLTANLGIAGVLASEAFEAPTINSLGYDPRSDIKNRLRAEGHVGRAREIIFFNLVAALEKRPLDFTDQKFGADSQVFSWR